MSELDSVWRDTNGPGKSAFWDDLSQYVEGRKILVNLEQQDDSTYSDGNYDYVVKPKLKGGGFIVFRNIAKKSAAKAVSKRSYYDTDEWKQKQQDKQKSMEDFAKRRDDKMDEMIKALNSLTSAIDRLCEKYPS